MAVNGVKGVLVECKGTFKFVDQKDTSSNKNLFSFRLDFYQSGVSVKKHFNEMEASLNQFSWTVNKLADVDTTSIAFFIPIATLDLEGDDFNLKARILFTPSISEEELQPYEEYYPINIYQPVDEWTVTPNYPKPRPDVKTVVEGFIDFFLTPLIFIDNFLKFFSED